MGGTQYTGVITGKFLCGFSARQALMISLFLPEGCKLLFFVSPMKGLTIGKYTEKSIAPLRVVRK